VRELLQRYVLTTKALDSNEAMVKRSSRNDVGVDGRVVRFDLQASSDKRLPRRFDMN
jgi:hypothetical protein